MDIIDLQLLTTVCCYGDGTRIASPGSVARLTRHGLAVAVEPDDEAPFPGKAVDLRITRKGRALCESFLDQMAGK